MNNFVSLLRQGWYTQNYVGEYFISDLPYIANTDFDNAPETMRKLVSQFQVACLQLRHKGGELFEFLKCASGLVRITHRAPYALPVHVLVCLPAYSLYKHLIA